MLPISASTWVALAQLLRPQGRRGELLAMPLSDLSGIFATGTEVFLAAPSAAVPPPGATARTLEGHFFPTGKNAGRIVLKLSGCDSISEAELLAGQQLLVASTHLPPLDPDTFFVGDLVGCTLYDGDTPIGTVIDLEFATAPDGRTRLEEAAPLLVVDLIQTTPQTPNQDQSPDLNQDASDPVLIPFVRAWLDHVDIPTRRITMHLPEGLLEEEEEEEEEEE